MKRPQYLRRIASINVNTREWSNNMANTYYASKIDITVIRWDTNAPETIDVEVDTIYSPKVTYGYEKQHLYDAKDLLFGEGYLTPYGWEQYNSLEKLCKREGIALTYQSTLVYTKFQLEKWTKKWWTRDKIKAVFNPNLSYEQESTCIKGSI